MFLMLIFWIGINVSDIENLPINKFWGIGINFIPLFGGIFGLYTAEHWGGLKSAVGKAMVYLSLGLLSWSLGNWIWSYYNFFLNSEIPYPSLADVGYVCAVPLWMIGSIYLSKATGIKYGLKNKMGQIYLFVLPILTFIISYYLLITVARGGSITSGGGLLKVFFDFAYPVGDVIIVTIALLVYGLSLKYLGGRFKWPAIITLLGFIVMFLADFSFSYTTTIGTYFNGSYPDLLFASALFVISFGIASFDTKA